MKNHNILNTGENAAVVASIYFCTERECRRALVTYLGALSSSKHAAGLPDDTIVLLRNMGKQFVPTHCDKHGGPEYLEPKQYPNEKLDREQSRILCVAQMGGMTVEQTTYFRNLYAGQSISPIIFEGHVVPAREEMI